MCTFWDPKHENAISDSTTPCCTPTLVYMSARVSTDDKSLDRIELSQFIQFITFLHWLQVGGQVGEAMSRDMWECLPNQTCTVKCQNIKRMFKIGSYA